MKGMSLRPRERDKFQAEKKKKGVGGSQKSLQKKHGRGLTNKSFYHRGTAVGMTKTKPPEKGKKNRVTGGGKNSRNEKKAFLKEVARGRSAQNSARANTTRPRQKKEEKKNEFRGQGAQRSLMGKKREKGRTLTSRLKECFLP